MRKIVTLAALALALAAPGSAMAFPHFGGHGPWGHGWGHGWGWGALGLGVGAVVIGETCWRERPVYDRDGEVVGMRRVFVCD